MGMLEGCNVGFLPMITCLVESGLDKQIRKSAVFLSLGAEVAGMIGASALVGYWLDGEFDTGPLFIIIFVLAGTVATFWRILRILRWIEERDGQ